MSGAVRRLDAQQAMGRYLRNPEHEAAPADIEPRRLAVYRELIYNNIEGFISSGFPVLRSLYEDGPWHALVRAFIVQHRCRSPYFLQVSQEFLQFVMERYERQPGDPPFMAELAHYEWLELHLDVSEASFPDSELDPDGDVLDGIPVVSPLVVAAAYHYPVHMIGPSFSPTEPAEQPHYLLVYRNRQEQVKFMETNAPTMQLLEQLQRSPEASGEQVLRAMAPSLGMDETALLGFGRQLLETLREHTVIAGVRLRNDT